MEILLVEKDPLVRDQVKVGLQQFPEFQVTCGQGYAGINHLRQHTFDCVFLGVDARNRESTRLLEHLRSFDSHTEVVVLTAGRNAKDLQSEKGRLNINSFLQTPVDVNEFFAFVGRFLERRAEVATSSVRQGARGASSIRR